MTYNEFVKISDALPNLYNLRQSSLFNNLVKDIYALFLSYVSDSIVSDAPVSKTDISKFVKILGISTNSKFDTQQLTNRVHNKIKLISYCVAVIEAAKELSLTSFSSAGNGVSFWEVTDCLKILEQDLSQFFDVSEVKDIKLELDNMLKEYKLWFKEQSDLKDKKLVQYQKQFVSNSNISFVLNSFKDSISNYAISFVIRAHELSFVIDYRKYSLHIDNKDNKGLSVKLKLIGCNAKPNCSVDIYNMVSKISFVDLDDFHKSIIEDDKNIVNIFSRKLSDFVDLSDNELLKLL